MTLVEEVAAGSVEKWQIPDRDEVAGGIPDAGVLEPMRWGGFVDDPFGVFVSAMMLSADITAREAILRLAEVGDADAVLLLPLLAQHPTWLGQGATDTTSGLSDAGLGQLIDLWFHHRDLSAAVCVRDAYLRIEDVPESWDEPCDFEDHELGLTATVDGFRDCLNRRECVGWQARAMSHALDEISYLYLAATRDEPWAKRALKVGSPG